MRKRVLVIFMSLAMLFVLVSCGKKEEQEISNHDVSKSSAVSEKDSIDAYIEEHYGLCDDTVKGVYTSAMNGNSVDSQIIEVDDDCKSGALFYDVVKEENGRKNIICVYLLQDDDSYTLNVSLNVDYFELDERGILSSNHTIGYGAPKMKSRYYFSVTGSYLTVIEMTEDSSGIFEMHYYLARDVDEHDTSLSFTEYFYEEKVCVYDLNNDLEKVGEISRNITPPNPNETKMCEISYGDDIFSYASGFASYTYEGATLLTTEQEFCDKANDLLHDLSISEVTFTRTSWANRWYRLEVDESGISDHMVKVDCSVTGGIPDGNGHVSSEVAITKNAEKEEHGELQAEAPDDPVSYDSTENSNENTIIMPENIPSSIDASQLQELTYFNLDGFWYSSDLHYVFAINVGSQFYNTFRCVNLQNSDGIKNGSMQQTSSYSINLKPNQSNEKAFEVFAVNGQLVSDEITLIKVNDNVVSSFLGSWQNGDTTYRFDNDGKYSVLMKNDSYWGYFFPIDESQIVLGVYSDNFKKINDSFERFDYTLDDNSFIINGMVSLRR